MKRARLRQHAPQRSVAPRQRDLTKADSRAAADERQLGEIAVRAQREAVAAQARQGLADAPDEIGRLVISDERVVLKVARIARRAVAAQVLLGRMQAKFDP